MPRQPKPENQLCDAPRRGKKELDPSVCQNCISPCVPGKEWLKTLGMERQKREGVDLVDNYNEFQMPRSLDGLFRYINRKGLYVHEN